MDIPHSHNVINTDFKGTAGPWRYVNQAHATKKSGLGQRYAVKAGDEWVYNVALDKTEDLELHRRTEANAHLIAAAPDLLAACDDLLQYWLGTYGESEVTAFAQKAINKALGK